MTVTDDNEDWWHGEIMTTDEVREYLGLTPPSDLQHSGVKGMKWGVRREHASVKTASTDRKKIDKALEKQKAKGTHALTNKELGDLNKRLQLEKSLKQLQTNPAKLTVKKGHEHVKEILAIGGTLAAVVSFAQSDKGRAISKALEGKVVDLVINRPTGKHFAP